MDNECNNCIVRLYGNRGFNVHCKRLITAADIEFFVLLILKQFDLLYKYTTVYMDIYGPVCYSTVSCCRRYVILQ